MMNCMKERDLSYIMRSIQNEANKSIQQDKKQLVLLLRR
jgi:hypothetical protein